MCCAVVFYWCIFDFKGLICNCVVKDGSLPLSSKKRGGACNNDKDYDCKVSLKTIKPVYGFKDWKKNIIVKNKGLINSWNLHFFYYCLQELKLYLSSIQASEGLVSSSGFLSIISLSKEKRIPESHGILAKRLTNGQNGIFPAHQPISFGILAKWFNGKYINFHKRNWNFFTVK